LKNTFSWCSHFNFCSCTGVVYTGCRVLDLRSISCFPKAKGKFLYAQTHPNRHPRSKSDFRKDEYLLNLGATEFYLLHHDEIPFSGLHWILSTFHCS